MKSANLMRINTDLNVDAPEFVSSSSIQSPVSSFNSSLSSYSLRSTDSFDTYDYSCNVQNWWYENKTLFDDSYDDMKKIFGWSKVPIRKTIRNGELSKLNVDMEHPIKKFKTSLTPIKEVEMSYAKVVLQNTLRIISNQS
jgi:hypothetical protein